MVTLRRPPRETDLVIVGGGPAGLATALAARRRGLDVVVADRVRPPIDKACGEGLLPDGIAALQRLGVTLPAALGIPFRGIRFVESERSAAASFAAGHGLGLRRTHLHRLLMECAEDAGVVTCWGSDVDALDPAGVLLNGQTVRCRWIIGADGLQSRVRRWAGLAPVWTSARRIGVRQHFHMRPWTDFVEVHWHRDRQAYVTPIGHDEICVALLGRAPAPRFLDLPKLFPGLAKRLQDAQPIGPARGAVSLSTKLRSVTRGRIALVGDASGSVDAITGEGLALAFRHAHSLAEALAEDDLPRYDAVHRRIGRLPRVMARLLLLMDRHDGLRRHVLRGLAAWPRVFDHLLAIHSGGPASEVSPRDEFPSGPSPADNLLGDSPRGQEWTSNRRGSGRSLRV